MKKAFLTLVGLTVLIAVAFTAKRHPLVQAMFGNWDFVKSAQRDANRYYRLKVKLVYKGEPEDFDIVVACNVRQTNYMDGGRTYEVGLTPSVFGRRMSDDKGLVVRPPRACRGETTENGGVPPDLLPLVVVYDDSETLAFGTAYLSDDAYESPLSVLQFGGATIERADRSAFEQFRREQPNLVKRSSYHTPSGVAGLKEYGLPAARIPMGIGCYGYARFRLLETGRERARELWPAEHPQYWRPATEQDRDAIDPNKHGRQMLTDHEGATPVRSDQILPELDVEIANHGMPRRQPVTWDNRPRPVSPSYYSDIGGWIALPWPADAAARAEILLREGPHVGASVDFRNGATRGFGYCRPVLQDFPTGVAYRDPTKVPYIPYVRQLQMNFVDGIEVANRLIGWLGPPLIVERDEYIFKLFTISLPSTRGDV